MGKWKLNYNDDLAIRDLYLDGVSCVKISKRYNMTHQAILKSLDRTHTQRRTISDANTRFRCNNKFFDVIDNEKKAYWLGFISGDGYLNTNKKQLVLCLAVRDLIHMQKFKEDIESQHNIKTYNYTHPFCKIIISDKHMYKTVRGYFDNKKSFSLRMPELQADLISHYIRGYFDANGSISGERNPQFEITSNKFFIEDIRNSLIKNLNLNITKNNIRHKETPTIQNMRYGGRNNLINIYNYLYKDGGTCLWRKKVKFQRLLNLEGRQLNENTGQARY
jgi:hypothetical protein